MAGGGLNLAVVECNSQLDRILDGELLAQQRYLLHDGPVGTFALPVCLRVVR